MFHTYQEITKLKLIEIVESPYLKFRSREKEWRHFKHAEIQLYLNENVALEMLYPFIQESRVEKPLNLGEKVER